MKALKKLGFTPRRLLGRGSAGKLYLGTLKHNGQVVVVRQLPEGEGLKGKRDFLLQVLILSLVQHENVVSLTGYCTDGAYRLLVYEYVPMGPLHPHLDGCITGKKPLDWDTRMRIAAGIAKGLDYLHNKTDPPMIHGNLRPSKILLDENFCPKLYDVGLSHLKHKAVKCGVESAEDREYIAPECYSTGPTVDSDVYSFGLILLQLITGRKAFDAALPKEEQSLVSWARPMFKDKSTFPKMADSNLNGIILLWVSTRQWQCQQCASKKRLPRGLPWNVLYRHSPRIPFSCIDIHVLYLR